MKLFKRIYYPIMAVLVVFMLVMGFVDASTGGASKRAKQQADGLVYTHIQQITDAGPHNSYNTANQETVRNYIIGQLTREGSPIVRYYNDTLDDDGNNRAEFAFAGNVKQPTLYVQTATVRQDTMRLAGDDYAFTAVGKEVNNIIVVVPGTDTLNDTEGTQKPGAVLITVPYDSSPIGGAADAAAVGNLLENAIYAAQNTPKTKNDLVFVFTDGDKEGNLGTLTFLNQQKGFNDLTDRIAVAADFEAAGNKGIVSLYQTSDGNSKLMGQYARRNGNRFVSSISEILYSLTSGHTGLTGMGDRQTLAFTTMGGGKSYATALDTPENLSKGLVAQQFDVMNKFYEHFGNADLTKLDANTSSVFFSYLNIMTIAYPTAVAFVGAGIILGLIVAIILLNRKNKAFGWGKVLAGAFVQLLTVLATALVLFVAYYLFALILTGFGVLTLHSLTSAVFTSPGLMISAMLFTFAVAAAFYIILKRTFAVKAPDVVRGNTLLWALAAFILCFALPAGSYLFATVGILSLTVLLLTTIFRNAFKRKFGMDIERLFLYVWPVVIALPLFVPVFMMSMSVAPAVFMPVVMAVFVGLLGFITPYTDYLKPILDKVVKKLPPRTIRYERVVTEQVEDRAKKGKFTEVTSKKVFKEKVAWNYLNRVGVAVVAVVAAVMILLFTSFGNAYSSALAGSPAYSNAIYDDSLLFVWEKTSAGETSTVEVHDEMAYKYIAYAVRDLKWDSTKKAYTKEYTGLVSDIMPQTPQITSSNGVVSFETFDSDYSYITLTLTDAESVSEVTFNKDNANRESETYEFSGQDTIVFHLPYGYGDFDITLNEGAACTVTFEQHIYNAKNLNYTGSDWEKLYAEYAGDDAVIGAIKSGMVLRITQSI